MIETYQIQEKGYHPFLIREGWQVAQLNYMPEQDITNITRLDVHHLTDEVFVLLKGNAVLIAASIVDGYVDFKMELMKPNITYNIPKGTWHNIAMTKGCETLIVEKSNTHISDFEFYPLNETKLEELRSRVNELLNSAIKATLTKQ
jgi:mannose-6-phosphate isomerase-like protein (cupin superfamily)